jgi:hypothetical protein
MTYPRLSRCRLPAVLLGFLAFACLSPAFAAGAPAGMVMAVTGNTNPAMPAMSEIPAQTPVALDPGASMTFILYSRCKLVTVNGGTLMLTGADFTTSGQVVSQEDTECPGRFDLSEPAVGAGEVPGVVRFRGVAPRNAGNPLRMTPNAQIVFSGGKSDRVNSALLYAAGRSDQPLIRYDLYLRRAIAPKGAPPVTPGTRYTLRLTVNGEGQPLEVPVVGAPLGGATFVVVRVN